MRHTAIRMAAVAALAVFGTAAQAAPEASYVIFDGVILGAATPEGWVDAEALQEGRVKDDKGNEAANPLRIWGGHDCTVYSQSASLGEGVITAPHGDHGDKQPYPGLHTAGVERPAGKSTGLGDALLATNAPEPVRPRQFKALSTGNAVYEKIVKAWLGKNGLPNAKPRIVQLYRGDLDGDGTDEVLITAASPEFSGADFNWKPDKPLSANAMAFVQEKKGAYCVTLLRVVSGGGAKEIELSKYIGRKDSDPSQDGWLPPSAVKFHQAADLNGDGRMELITGWNAYAGFGYQVWEYNRGKLKAVLEAGFTP